MITLPTQGHPLIISKNPDWASYGELYSSFHIATGPVDSLIDTGAISTRLYAENQINDHIFISKTNAGEFTTHVARGGTRYLHNLAFDNVFLSDDIPHGLIGMDVLLGHKSWCFDLQNQRFLNSCNLDKLAHTESYKLPFYFGLANEHAIGMTAMLFVDIKIGGASMLALLDTGALLVKAKANFCPQTTDVMYLEDFIGNLTEIYADVHLASVSFGEFFTDQNIALVCQYSDSDTPHVVIGSVFLNQWQAFQLDFENKNIIFYR